MTDKEAVIDLLVASWIEKVHLLKQERVAIEAGGMANPSMFREVNTLFRAMEEILSDIGDGYIVHDVIDAEGKSRAYVVEIRDGRCDVAMARHSDQLP